MKTSLLFVAGVLATGLISTTAGAAPLGTFAKNAITSDAPLIELVHNGNGHRACELGQRGWHYHNRRGDRIECRPVRPGYRYWVWRSEGGRSGWWHSNERRWH